MKDNHAPTPPTTGFELSTPKRWLRNGVVVLLLLWPPVHGFLAWYFGFSPWRFAGWGMYSTIYHVHSAVKVVLPWNGRIPEDLLLLHSNREIDLVEESHGFPRRLLDGLSVFNTLSQEFDTLAALRRSKDVQVLWSRLKKALPPLFTREGGLLIISRPRLVPAQRQIFNEVFVFGASPEGEVRWLGRYELFDAAAPAPWDAIETMGRWSLPNQPEKTWPPA